MNVERRSISTCRSGRSNGVFCLGSYQYYIGKQFAHRCIEIRFEPDLITFLCQPEGSEELVRVPAQGLTKAELMGNWRPCKPCHLSISVAFFA